MNLDIFISDTARGISEGDIGMPSRIREKVIIDGQIRWISGYSMQELMNNYVKLLVQEGKLEFTDENHPVPYFKDYLKEFYSTFKQKQQQNTIVNRERIIRNHILPAFGDKKIDKIHTMDIQQFFNTMSETYAQETMLKIKNIMSPVFDSAVEDEIISRNPFASKKLEIIGKETVSHKAIPTDKFLQIENGLKCLAWRERVMCALLCYTGMRFEEVLGVKWEDISDGWVTVRRAVVHPNRNLPEVKCPKTKTSERRIPLMQDLIDILEEFDGEKTGYLLYSNSAKNHSQPLSYSESRRSFAKIRNKFDIHEYTAHDFRDTCATIWRENGIELDVIARLLGHSKTSITEKRYVKYRDGMLDSARDKMLPNPA